jgi:PAS domain-containing protein
LGPAHGRPARTKALQKLSIPAFLPSGRTIWIRRSGKPVFDENSVFQGYFGVSTDITDEITAR